MIINDVLDYIFTSPAATAVLRELNLRRTGITGRETARRAGITHKSALSILSNFEQLKLVKKENAGRAYFFTVNRQHYIFKNIIDPVFNIEKDMASSLFIIIAQKLGRYAESIIVFGSVARGNETLESDLDICIIFNSGKKKLEPELSNLRGELYDTYGVTLAPFLISAMEFKKKAKSKKPPVSEIIKEGKVIYGKSLTEIING
jgi:predicted nucleotidyltransferase